MRVTTTRRSGASSAPTASCLAPASGVGGAADTLGQDPQQALRPLTVDFHEGGFLTSIAQEDAFTQQHGFWFELSNADRGKAKSAWGPDDPQALNRYAYALDNPLQYTDPTGHYFRIIKAVMPIMVDFFAKAVQQLKDSSSSVDILGVLASAASAALLTIENPFLLVLASAAVGSIILAFQHAAVSSVNQAIDILQHLHDYLDAADMAGSVRWVDLYFTDVRVMRGCPTIETGYGSECAGGRDPTDEVTQATLWVRYDNGQARGFTVDGSFYNIFKDWWGGPPAE